MSQVSLQRNAAKSPSTNNGRTTPAKAESKDWSIKVKVRLPHKIGVPLGSDGSDGGG